MLFQLAHNLLSCCFLCVSAELVSPQKLKLNCHARQEVVTRQVSHCTVVAQVAGIPLSVVPDSLAAAAKARGSVLDCMAACSPALLDLEPSSKTAKSHVQPSDSGQLLRWQASRSAWCQTRSQQQPRREAPCWTAFCSPAQPL